MHSSKHLLHILSQFSHSDLRYMDFRRHQHFLIHIKTILCIFVAYRCTAFSFPLLFFTAIYPLSTNSLPTLSIWFVLIWRVFVVWLLERNVESRAECLTATYRVHGHTSDENILGFCLFTPKNSYIIVYHVTCKQKYTPESDDDRRRAGERKQFIYDVEVDAVACCSFPFPSSLYAFMRKCYLANDTVRILLG